MVSRCQGPFYSTASGILVQLFRLMILLTNIVTRPLSARVVYHLHPLTRRAGWLATP